MAGAHLPDRQALRRFSRVRIDEDVDGALLAAGRITCPTRQETVLDVLLHLLAGELGDFAEVPSAGDRDRHERAPRRVELLDHGRVGADRELASTPATLSRTSWRMSRGFSSTNWTTSERGPPW